jgi:uncharacterized iron-regulated protein
VGRILDTESGATISRDELIGRLELADVVLLGEKHDNADHHRLQASLIESLGSGQRRPAVAFEMLSPGDRPALDEWRKSGSGDVDALGEALDWSHSGWPPWPLYRPIFAAIAARGLAIEPANLSRDALARVRHSGVAGLSAATRRRLALDPPLSAAARESLAEEIREGHCGMADDAMVDLMIDVQRVRDATLADALLAGGEPAVLIAGAGHVRKSRAVPLYLARRAPQRRVASLAFLEVGPDPAEREEGLRDFDFVWFTPRVDDLDPCDRFREELEKMRGRAAQAP